MEEASGERSKQRAYAIWRKAADELLIEAIFGSGSVVRRDGDVFASGIKSLAASSDQEPAARG
jgi:hypothetical protein